MSGLAHDLRAVTKRLTHSPVVPQRVTEAAIAGRDSMRLATAPWRVLPDFVIIGVHKGGTTSLYDYLAQHPQVVPAIEKEVHYFDRRYDGRDISYRASFPNSLRMGEVRRRYGRALTGEASPYYISHPHIPARVQAMTPSVKLVALLRNPVDRVVSAFHHNRRRTPNEPLVSLEDAVERELSTLLDEQQRIIDDERYPDFEYAWHCYLTRSIYVDQLRWWHACFDPDQLLVIQSEQLSSDPAGVVGTVQNFLGLDEWTLDEFERQNTNVYPDVDRGLRRDLVEFFSPHNERLFEYLGQRFDWT